MNAYPNAVRRFGYAAMEARAVRTREVMRIRDAVTADEAVSLLDRVARGELTADEALAMLEREP